MSTAMITTLVLLILAMNLRDASMSTSPSHATMATVALPTVATPALDARMLKLRAQLAELAMSLTVTRLTPTKLATDAWSQRPPLRPAIAST